MKAFLILKTAAAGLGDSFQQCRFSPAASLLYFIFIEKIDKSIFSSRC